MTSTQQHNLIVALHRELTTGTSRQFEQLASGLMSAFLNVRFSVARAGFQHGGDAGTAGSLDHHLRIEGKCYSDSTALNDKQIRGGIDDALNQNPDLDVWYLACTRDVNETTRNVLHTKSVDTGLPIVIVDWRTTGDSTPDLAALCACHPEVVETHYGTSAAQLARELAPFSEDRIATLRKELDAWHIGFNAAKEVSDRALVEIYNSESEARAQFAQNVAIGACKTHIERKHVFDQLQSWHERSTGAPAVLIGDEGVGKTWAVVQWACRTLRHLPITLLISSSTFCEIRSLNTSGVHDFIARELQRLASVRSEAFWRRRLLRMLETASSRDPCLLLIVDGMNQDPSFPWIRLFQILQGKHFAGARVVASTQRHFFIQDLRRLHDLSPRPYHVDVEPYDVAPNGELDQMLRLHGLARSDLPVDLIPLARNPRMFSLVIRFRDRMVTHGDATPIRLLWEYGLDELGIRTGRAFSEQEWIEWLRGIAATLRDQNPSPQPSSPMTLALSLTELSQSVSQPHRDAVDTQRRLSEILDDKWLEHVPGSSSKYRLKAETIALALGLGIVEHLREQNTGDVGGELSRLIDPIRASSDTASVLAASLSIAVSTQTPHPITTAIATELLQSQNASEKQLRDFVAVAPAIPISILDSMELCASHAHASARHWATTAIRRVPEKNQEAWTMIIQRLESWVAVTDCPSITTRKHSDEGDHYRSARLIELIGTDSPGHVTVLGVDIALRPFSDPYLGDEVPRILQGRRLDTAVSIFRAAATASALGMSRSDTWTGLKWLLIFDACTRRETIKALSEVADEITRLTPEAYVRSDLQPRVTALLLWLSGDPEMNVRARTTNPSTFRFFTYATDYLQDPATSFFTLEHRHIDLVFYDERLPIWQKYRRVKHLLSDPTFPVPCGLITEVETISAHFEVNKLSIGRFASKEEHDFDDLQVLAARTSPSTLAELCRRRAHQVAERNGEPLHWACTKAAEYLLLAGPKELNVIGRARDSYDIKDDRYASSAKMQLLLIQIPQLSPFEQLSAIANDSQAFLSIELFRRTEPCAPADIDAFLIEYGTDSERKTNVLLSYLSEHAIAISDFAFESLYPFSQVDGEHSLRIVAFMALENCAPERFGERLKSTGWTLQRDQTVIEMDCGSSALLITSKHEPLRCLQGKVAPWLLLREANLRADESGIRVAASSINSVLSSTFWLDKPAPVAMSITAGDRFSRVSFATLDDDDDDDITKALDDNYQDQKWKKVQDSGRAHISALQQSGAILHRITFSVADVRTLLLHCRETVDSWLDGMDANTAEFRLRIGKAGGLFVAICEALFELDPERAAMLWRRLEQSMPFRLIGIADISELTHILFRAPSSSALNALRDDIFSIHRNTTESAYLEIVVSAMLNGASGWLQERIAADETTDSAWRQRRAVMLKGMMDRPSIDEMTWPEGEIFDALETVRMRALLSQNMHAIAHHWWERFLASTSVEDSYAAWVMFLASVDRRCWIWMYPLVEEWRVKNDPKLWRLKMCHFETNRHQLKMAIRDREEKGSSKMSASLWGDPSPAKSLDMSIVVEGPTSVDASMHA